MGELLKVGTNIWQRLAGNEHEGINQVGPAQSDILHTMEGDKVPVVWGKLIRFLLYQTKANSSLVLSLFKAQKAPDG